MSYSFSGSWKAPFVLVRVIRALKTGKSRRKVAIERNINLHGVQLELCGVSVHHGTTTTMGHYTTCTKGSNGWFHIDDHRTFQVLNESQMLGSTVLLEAQHSQDMGCFIKLFKLPIKSCINSDIILCRKKQLSR